MNYTCITLHNEALDTIIDASIPNKAQNTAVKRQTAQATDVLMNRIAEGWLEDKAVSRADDPVPPPPATSTTVARGVMQVRGFPRRNRTDCWIPAERSIADLVQQVEALGCHPRLTDAVVALTAARDAVADWAEETGNVLPA